jgi:hypothetical protein
MSSHLLVMQALQADPALVALVGDRIRVDFAEVGDAYPFVIVKRAGLDFIRGLGGIRLGTVETFEVDCWGNTRSESVAVSEQANLALEAAQLYATQAQPDGVDPDLLARVTVLSVEI